MDRIILGHNQFFGIDHLDSSLGNKKEAYFSEIRKIKDIIQFSYREGVKAMMMSTHERAFLVAEEILKEKEINQDYGIYLLVPYIAKYIKQSNEKGVINIIKNTLSKTEIQKQLAFVFKGSIGLMTKDIEKIITLLIDFEVAPFSKLNLKAILLHDALTDLALGWQMPEIFELFNTYISKKYKTIPAFCTKNLTKLMELLNQTSIKNPLIMAAVNKIGYQVNPSLNAFEECLRVNKLRLLAMSTLAAGFLEPKEAYTYLFSLPNIEAVVVGVSNVNHAKETFNEIRQYIC